MRIAIGPFDPDPAADWPVRDAHQLAPKFELLPFGHAEPPPAADALVVWSPEYAHPDPAWFTGAGGADQYTVAVIGDHHVVPMEQIPELDRYALLATDLQGIARLRALGHPPEKLLYFRQFSFDPGLHTLPDEDAPREIAVAFMGRPAPGRDALIERVRAWARQQVPKVPIALETAPYPRGVEAAVYQRARVVLNYSQRDELNMRAYEAAACGALGVLQHGALAELQAAGAAHAIPTYEPDHVEAFLAAWLADPDRCAAAVRAQRAWVRRERPVDHLGYLCRQIAQRTSSRPSAQRARATPVAGTPTIDEQRLDCVALVPPGARRILDVGCGSGGVAWALKARDPRVHVTGIDADPAEAGSGPTSRWRGALDRFWAADAGAASTFDPLYEEGERFDAILCLDVLEHLYDPWTVLVRLRRLLAPDGVLVASVPNLRNAANTYTLLVDGAFRYFRHGQMEFAGPHDNVLSWGHIRFFTRRSLGALFRDAGYAITEARATSLGTNDRAARWVDDLALLIGHHGGDAAAWREEAGALQFLVVARPDPTVPVLGAAGAPAGTPG